jgi:hypothetical protein
VHFTFLPPNCGAFFQRNSFAFENLSLLEPFFLFASDILTPQPAAQLRSLGPALNTINTQEATNKQTNKQTNKHKYPRRKPNEKQKLRHKISF